jgi:hypothetical protein
MAELNKNGAPLESRCAFKFPARGLEIPCYGSEKFPGLFDPTDKRSELIARKHWGYPTGCLYDAKFPVFIPVNGNSRRDEFAQDCIHRQ